MQTRAVLAPMLIAAVGILLSIIGIFLVRTKEGATMRQLLRALGVGVNVSSVLIAAATFIILYLLDIQNWLGLSFSVITGLAAGIIIGQATEYYTSHTYRPTQKIARSGQTGPATVIISGIGVAGVMGLLVGGLSSGFVLAVFMANSGGAWDNAKKLIEEGNFGGKGSECHKATVVGDTVGDPFKDTSGPSLNILIKLMSMVSIVMAGLTVAWHLF